MILCLNTGSVAKLVVVGSEFQTLTTLSSKNWLRTSLLRCDLKSLYACPLVPLVAQNSKKSEKLNFQQTFCSIVSLRDAGFLSVVAPPNCSRGLNRFLCIVGFGWARPTYTSRAVKKYALSRYL